MAFLLTRHWKTMSMDSAENHNPCGTHHLWGTVMIRLLQEGLQRLENRRLLVSFPKAPGQYSPVLPGSKPQARCLIAFQPCRGTSS